MVAFAAQVYVVPLTELLQVVRVSLEQDLLQVNSRLQLWGLPGADGSSASSSWQLKHSRQESQQIRALYHGGSGCLSATLRERKLLVLISNQAWHSFLTLGFVWSAKGGWRLTVVSLRPESVLRKHLQAWTWVLG